MMDKKVREEVLKVRASGICNMLDLPFVQRVAFDNNFFDLVLFISDHKDEYVRFILYGDGKDV